MRQFIVKVLFFCVLALIVVEVYPLYLLFTEKYKTKVDGKETYVSIEKSKKKFKSKKVILGDSAARQMFSNLTFNDSINSLACNQAISVAGQYILLQNYLDAGNRPEQVMMFYSPFSFGNNLDQVYTYHHFVKPFYRDYQEYFSPLVVEQIQKIPYIGFHRIPNILTSNWAPVYGIEEYKEPLSVSQVSVSYLLKIDSLSQRYEFTFTLHPVPTKNSFQTLVNTFDKKEIEENNLNHLFEGYFQEFIFVDDAQFKDKTHLKNPEEYTALLLKRYFSNP
jgi:hypothetical protein